MDSFVHDAGTKRYTLLRNEEVRMLWCLAALAQDGEIETATVPDTTEESARPEPSVEPDSVVPEVEAPAPPPKTYALPPVEGRLPSALTTKADIEDESGALSEFLKSTGLEMGDFDRPTLVHGRWFVRPHTAISQLIGDDIGGPVALRLGMSVGRRYTTLKVLPVQLLSEIGVKASTPIFGAVGRRVEGFANIGPWLGPVRIQLGFHGRWEQERWRKQVLVLGNGVLVGGELTAALDAGPLLFNVGIAPMVGVSGERPSARDGDPLLPVLGSETTYSAGVGVKGKALGLRVHGAWRDTHIGSLLEVGLSVSINLAEANG